MKITPTETCGDCNGTGADYGADMRKIACSACGGNGWIEFPAVDWPNATEQAQALLVKSVTGMRDEIQGERPDPYSAAQAMTLAQACHSTSVVADMDDFARTILMQAHNYIVTANCELRRLADLHGGEDPRSNGIQKAAPRIGESGS